MPLVYPDRNPFGKNLWKIGDEYCKNIATEPINEELGFQFRGVVYSFGFSWLEYLFKHLDDFFVGEGKPTHKQFYSE